MEKYYNAMVKVQFSGQDPKSKEEAVSRALKKLDNKLKLENWRYDIERKRYFMNPTEAKRLKKRMRIMNNVNTKPSKFEEQD